MNQAEAARAQRMQKGYEDRIKRQSDALSRLVEKLHQLTPQAEVLTELLADLNEMKDTDAIVAGELRAKLKERLVEKAVG